MSCLANFTLRQLVKARLREAELAREEETEASKLRARVADLEKQRDMLQDEVAALRVKLDLERTID